jgi:tellurite resistance protein
VGDGRILRLMHEEEFAIVRALVPVAWADGEFADKEKEMLEALLDAYGANDNEKQQLREYAKEKRTLDDINLQDLAAADRRVLLQCAVLLTFADGEQHASESKLLGELATKLRIPDEEAKHVIAEAETRAKKNLNLLT